MFLSQYQATSPGYYFAWIGLGLVRIRVRISVRVRDSVKFRVRGRVRVSGTRAKWYPGKVACIAYHDRVRVKCGMRKISVEWSF